MAVVVVTTPGWQNGCTRPHALTSLPVRREAQNSVPASVGYYDTLWQHRIGTLQEAVQLWKLRKTENGLNDVRVTTYCFKLGIGLWVPDVTFRWVTSYSWASLCLKSVAIGSFIQQLVQAEYNKTTTHCITALLCDKLPIRWIPLTQGQ